MSKDTQHPAMRLIRALYQQTPGGFVELRAIPVDRLSGHMPQQVFASTPGQVLSFIDAFGQKGSPYSAYYGVNKREVQKGTKEAVKRVCALYVDVDTVKNGWDTDAMVKRIHSMKGVLRPSACVRSGGGLHLYWFVKLHAIKSHDDVGAIEQVNAKLRDIFAGDAVQNVDRILRLPGTYNTKRKAKVELVWCYEFERNFAATIEEFSDAFKQCIGDDGEWTTKAQQLRKDMKTRVVRDPALDAYQRMFTGEREASKSLERMWRERVRYTAPRGYIGIHEAALIHTARLYIANPDYPEDTVVKLVMKEIKRVKDRDAPGEAWDMKKEAATVLKMFHTFAPKWHEFDKERRRQQAAERKKLNGGADTVRQRRR